MPVLVCVMSVLSVCVLSLQIVEAYPFFNFNKWPVVQAGALCFKDLRMCVYK